LARIPSRAAQEFQHGRPLRFFGKNSRHSGHEITGACGRWPIIAAGVREANPGHFAKTLEK